MEKWKVVYTDTLYPDIKIEEDVLKQIGAEVVFADSKDLRTLREKIRDCDALIVTDTLINDALLDCMEKCKVIVRSGTGYNNVDTAAAGARGIMVANVADYCMNEVADHAMGLILDVIRKISYLNAAVHNGVWDFAMAKNVERLNRLTLGLYGFGRIGQALALRAKAFGMKVMAYDPYLPDAVFSQQNVIKMDTAQALLANADVLSLHLPLSQSTRGLMDREAFRQMKPTAYFINVSRGGLVDEEALYEALRTGEIAGCALDVMVQEPPDIHAPLFSLENVILTPHSSFSSLTADVELRVKTAQAVVETYTQGQPKFWVNKDCFSSSAVV